MQSEAVGKFCSKQFRCNKRLDLLTLGRGCIKRILLIFCFRGRTTLKEYRSNFFEKNLNFFQNKTKWSKIKA